MYLILRAQFLTHDDVLHIGEKWIVCGSCGGVAGVVVQLLLGKKDHEAVTTIKNQVLD